MRWRGRNGRTDEATREDTDCIHTRADDHQSIGERRKGKSDFTQRNTRHMRAKLQSITGNYRITNWNVTLTHIYKVWLIDWLIDWMINITFTFLIIILKPFYTLKWQFKGFYFKTERNSEPRGQSWSWLFLCYLQIKCMTDRQTDSRIWRRCPCGNKITGESQSCQSSSGQIDARRDRGLHERHICVAPQVTVRK